MSNVSTSAVSSASTGSPTSVNNDTNGVVETSTSPSPKSTSKVETGTASLAPVPEPSTIIEIETPSTPAPVIIETPQATEAAPPVSSTIIPPIVIQTTSTRSSTPKAQTPISISISPTIVPERPTTFETTVSSVPPTTTAPLPKSSSKTAASSSSSSNAVPPPASGSPFGGSEGQSDKGKSGKSSGSKIAGAIGGLSAAILVGLIVFFLWKWKTRGKYRFNKRQSFDPYGNGIDANRGGLLVSSVACKPGDQISANDTLYSDDNSPTRYHRRSVDLTREPTIPVLNDSPPSQPAFPNMTAQPPRPAGNFNDSSRDQFQPFKPEMAMAAMSPLTGPSQRQPPVLYERRRPPVPPSMRRNRSPPNRGYDAGAMEMQQGISPSTSPQGHSMMGAPRPNLYPHQSQGYAGPGSQVPRANSISSQMPTRLPDLAQMDRNQRVRRSMSLGNLNARPDPLTLHPAIPEVPSNTTSPRQSTNLPGPGMHQRSSSLTAAAATRSDAPEQGATNGFWVEPETPRQLMVRNPSPPPAEKNRKQLGDMVRRMGSMRQGGEHKVGLAAKNF